MRAFDTLVSPLALEIEQRQHDGSDKAKAITTIAKEFGLPRNFRQQACRA
jgi:hypothetical protein